MCTQKKFTCEKKGIKLRERKNHLENDSLCECEREPEKGG